MLHFTRSLVVSYITVLLSACGGDGGNSTTDTKQTGVFFDSPVENISYRTNTLEGVTNSFGEYEYIEGETVTFFIGDIEFPSTLAVGIITPLELAGTEDISNSQVVNILRLLQSLDKDNNPSNGITITDAAKSLATEIDFTMSETEFESSFAIVNLIANAGQDNMVSGLVSTEAAITHFEEEIELLAVFRVAEISGRSFSVNFNAGGSLNYEFFPNGSGVEFNEEGETGLTWSINTFGELVVSTADFTDTYNLVSGNAISGELDIHISDRIEGISNTTGTITKIQSRFTKAVISGGTFSVSFDNAGSLVYKFGSEDTSQFWHGTGTVNDGEGEFDSTWTINSEGSLVVTTDFFIDVYILTSGNAFSGDLYIFFREAYDGTTKYATGTIVKLPPLNE